MRHARRHGALAALLLVVAAGCGNGEEPSTDDGPAAEEPGGADEDDTDEGDTAADGEDTTATDDGEVRPVGDEPGTDPVGADGEPGALTVTDVRFGRHDGFDRVVIELAGDGTPGFDVRYAPDGVPTAQGSGRAIDVAGDAALEVAVRTVALPADRPDDVTAWEGDRLEAPDGGAVTEVVEDTIFEGVHTFVIGVREERPFSAARLSDPHRLVIDVHHG